MPPKEALRKIVEAVGEGNEENGVVLLVDMGSLTTFSEEIVRQTGIDVGTVEMVTRPNVLEEVRKTPLIGTQMATLH
ncbi:hypothetical protein ACQ1ZS_15530, partial [Enterococcus faecalis]|uniref:PTS sugar transporter subunit IIA domain-containing protein n=1 Tax=Enterococcus faecalis TaxID=1351 RepID=UPI003D6BEC28